MMYMKIYLIWLFLNDKSIITESIITVYKAEGSTLNLTFTMTRSEIDVRFNKRLIYHNIDHKKVNTKKYDMVLHPNILEFQLINLTTKDTGIYWLDDRGLSDTLKLDITKTSCPLRATEQVCAIEGSSSVLTFIFGGPLYYSNIRDGPFLGDKSRSFSNVTLLVDLHIYNVTLEDKGLYTCEMYDFGRAKLQVVKIWFVNQTDQNQLVGQEDTEMEIKCVSATEEIITALRLESYGTIKAIGDKQSVSYSFKPDRTDHLSKYKCVDSTHTSIMIEVELFIKYPPTVTVLYSNDTIQCECDGVPAIYSVYRLNQISESGELVRSINMKNEIFTFQNESFPYQINGRYECVVSNGIPDIDGKILQTGSRTVQYEGAPVFAMENRPVKIGKVGDSIELSFHIYSFPDVEEIFLEKLGKTHIKKRKISNYKVLNNTLRYTEFNNVSVQGYEYLIETEKLNIDDFQAYCITAINRLGAGDYRFEIIMKENTTMTKRKPAPFLIYVIICVILIGVATMVYFCVWKKRTQVRAVRDHTLPADPNYDVIGSISYIDVSNFRLSHTNINQDRHLTHQGSSRISKRENKQTIADNKSHTSDEITSDFCDFGILQRKGIAEVHQQVSMSSNDSHVSSIDVSGFITIIQSEIQSTDNILHTSKEIVCSQSSHTHVDSCSEPSNNVLEESIEDAFENPYEYISPLS